MDARRAANEAARRNLHAATVCNLCRGLSIGKAKYGSRHAAKTCIGLTRRDGAAALLLLAQTRSRAKSERQAEDVADGAKRRKREGDDDVAQ